MITRRDLALAAAAIGTARASEAELLAFEPLGQVTLLHLADLHAQLVPVHFREASSNLGAGAARGQVPHLSGEALLAHWGIARGTPMAHALTDVDFPELARRFGPMGGLPAIARIIRAVRAERPAQTLLLDGGDTLQGSWTALQSRGADMVEAMRLLGIDATTAHWEFTYGAARLRELVAAMPGRFLAGNVQDNEFEDDVFEHTAMFERGGVQIAVIGQAFPYTPIANPRWLVPDWSFGIKEEKLRERVVAARAAGAGLVVLLSHNGFGVDRRIAERVSGIDVILSAHTHDALPVPLRVGRTLLLASGCHGKFVTRLDLEIGSAGVRGFRHALIPIFAERITPDAEAAALVARLRAPHAAELARVVGRTETTLWRRGNLNGTMDDLFCAAIAREMDAEIALSPGFRWGGALLPGQDVTAEDVWAQSAITYPGMWRATMTGAALRGMLEDIAENLFHPDPYAQQGGDMVRVGGIGFTLDPDAGAGTRIRDLRRLSDGAALEAGRGYAVAGWASVQEGQGGRPVWEAVFNELARGPVRLQSQGHVRFR